MQLWLLPLGAREEGRLRELLVVPCCRCNVLWLLCRGAGHVGSNCGAGRVCSSCSVEVRSPGSQ